MCNRYRPASVIRIRDVFGFTYIESGPPLEERYKAGGIGPLQPGPFLHRGGLAVDRAAGQYNRSCRNACRSTRA